VARITSLCVQAFDASPLPSLTAGRPIFSPSD